jgi:hypothetical protein
VRARGLLWQGEHSALLHSRHTRRLAYRAVSSTTTPHPSRLPGSQLHALAQDCDINLSSPAILVVGQQTDGKSALIEALMGFNFNHVRARPWDAPRWLCA